MNKLFPLDRIVETDNFSAEQDWEVPIVGFFIIASKNKTNKSVADFDSHEVSELGELIRRVRLAMKEVLNIRDVYIFQNEDTEHGFHVWMFPRHEWMEQFGRKIESVRPIMQFAIQERSGENDIAEVKEAAKKVRLYLQSQ